jgi:(p)ppGpp synthase/HD superfamily hydrolase
MIFTSRMNEAIKLACHLHRHQMRKDFHSTPYVSHLFSVAMILSTVTDDEDIIIGGLLHDSLEDVPHYTYDNLVEDCGERVASIVKHVTEPLDASKMDNEQLPWLARKDQYLENLKAGGIESAMVSAADKIHNTESFLFDAELSGDAFMLKFSSSLRNKLWFHEQALAIVREKLGNENALVSRLSLCTEEFRKLCENKEPESLEVL